MVWSLILFKQQNVESQINTSLLLSVFCLDTVWPAAAIAKMVSYISSFQPQYTYSDYTLKANEVIHPLR